MAKIKVKIPSKLKRKVILVPPSKRYKLKEGQKVT
jgi:hypothetical protein